MKKGIGLILLVISTLILVGCDAQQDKASHSSHYQKGKVTIVEYADLKCPYCKKVDQNVMPKLKKDYLHNKNVEYQFVNMAFLGKDSIVGSRAEHAVKRIAPEKHLQFLHQLFEQQPKDEKAWLTEKRLDAEIDKLNLDEDKKSQIKKAYKTKDSQAWKDVEKDQERYKKHKVKQAPTVYINGEKLEDPYKYENYKTKIDKALKDKDK